MHLAVYKQRPASPPSDCHSGIQRVIAQTLHACIRSPIAHLRCSYSDRNGAQKGASAACARAAEEEEAGINHRRQQPAPCNPLPANLARAKSCVRTANN